MTLFLIEPCSHPEARLRELSSWPHSCSTADYVRITPDNAKARLKMHGKHCIPPYNDFTLSDLTASLSQRPLPEIYQFIVRDYSYEEPNQKRSRGRSAYASTQEGKPKERYLIFDTPPKGWLLIHEVCLTKDCGKSVVTKACYEKELTAALCRKDQRRYVKPDDKFFAWRPSRKHSYLRDRRIVMAHEVYRHQGSCSIDDWCQEIERLEITRFGMHYAEDDFGVASGDGQFIRRFFNDLFGVEAYTYFQFHARMMDLFNRYGLYRKKRYQRAYPSLLVNLEEIKKRGAVRCGKFSGRAVARRKPAPQGTRLSHRIKQVGSLGSGSPIMLLSGRAITVSDSALGLYSGKHLELRAPAVSGSFF